MKKKKKKKRKRKKKKEERKKKEKRKGERGKREKEECGSLFFENTSEAKCPDKPRSGVAKHFFLKPRAKRSAPISHDFLETTSEAKCLEKPRRCGLEKKKK